MLKLAQNQLWKQGQHYFRIVQWERLSIRYKETESAEATEGKIHEVSKKEFCKLIKGAELLS